MIRIFWTIVFLCISAAAHAQVVLGAKPERVDLWPQVRVLVDPTGTLSSHEALAMKDQFAIPKGAYATLGLDKTVVWLRVPVSVTAGGEGTWILDFDYAGLRLVDVYWIVGGKAQQHVVLGTDPPFATRPLRGRSHAMPLELAAGDSGELLVRVDSPAKIVPVSLARVPIYHMRSLNEQLLQGALGALGLFLILYSLAQWVSLREHLYIKYALLTVCSVTFTIHFFGIGEMYLWTDFKWAQRHLAGVTALMSAAATALFVEEALASDLNRWLRRGLKAVAAIHILATLAYGADVIDITVVAILMSTTGLAPALMGLPGALAKARRGDSIGGWFLAAWLGYFVTSAMMVAVVRGRLDATFSNMHAFQFGTMADMLIFMRIAVLRTASRHRDAQRAALERDRLHSLAHSDPLTGLLNRRGLDDALAEALARVTPDHLVSLYLLDLDGFKPVNDQYGHDVGDEVLRVIAQRLRGSVRSGDAVARVGGDEFVVMAEGLNNEAQARDLGMKLVESFHSPFHVREHSCVVTATVGYALAPMDASDANTLKKTADAAMYAGKEEGKDRLRRAA